jgi:hypothetical protein
MIYFLMRAIEEYHWNYSFFVFFSMILNYLSLDQLFRHSPATFHSLLYSSFGAFLVVLACAGSIAVLCGWGKRPPAILKYLAFLVGIFLYLLKTILVIPLANIAIVSIIPQISKNLNIEVSVQ